MVQLAGFNANEIDPNFGFEPLPHGDYLAILTESESKPTKDCTGSYLELTFQVIEGEFHGRNVWARLNLENKSDIAVKQARAELSAICHAVGVMQPNDSLDLHNLPLILTIGLEKRKDTGEFTNIIKEYKARGQYGMQPLTHQLQQQFNQSPQAPQNHAQQVVTTTPPNNPVPPQPPLQQPQTYTPGNPGPSPFVNPQPPQPTQPPQQPQNQTQQLQPQQQ